MEEKSLKEKVDELYEEKEKGRKKKFKVPLSIKLQKGKFKKGYAAVCLIKTNGAVEVKMVKIEDETIKIGENIYDASANNILRYKKYPLLIISEWNMKPFSPAENVEKASAEGTLTAAQKLILTKMKMEAVKPKMQLNFKLIVGLLVLGAAILFALDYFKLI